MLDYDFRKVIEWADIVATTGSGLEFIALAMGKPVLLLGRDILTGKDIAYEGHEPAALAGAISAAQAREGFEERTRRFYAYCGWLATEVLVSPSDAVKPCRTPEDVADDFSLSLLEKAGLLHNKKRNSSGNIPTRPGKAPPHQKPIADPNDDLPLDDDDRALEWLKG